MFRATGTSEQDPLNNERSVVSQVKDGGVQHEMETGNDLVGRFNTSSG